MGKRITVYLNEYYYSLFEKIRKKIEEEKGVRLNNTDLVKLALLSLKEKVLRED